MWLSHRTKNMTCQILEWYQENVVQKFLDFRVVSAGSVKNILPRKISDTLGAQKLFQKYSDFRFLVGVEKCHKIYLTSGTLGGLLDRCRQIMCRNSSHPEIWASTHIS